MRQLTRSLACRLAALLLLLCFSMPAHGQSWTYARSDNFIVYSDGPPLDLERWVRKAERFDLYLRAFFGMPPAAQVNSSPLTVYLLEDRNAVRKLLGQPRTTGFYSPSSEGTFAVAHRQPAYNAGDISGEMTLYHEYAHHFMYRHFPAAYPAWYREGFAEYVSTLTFGDSLATPTAPAQEHGRKSMRKHAFPIETILTAEIGAIEPEQRAAFYAWSRRLVHLLYSDTERTARLEAYLETFRRGGTAQEAVSFLGDLRQLQTALLAHTAADLHYPAAAPALAYAGPIQIAELDAVASDLVELHLRRRVAPNIRATVQGLRQLAGRAPGNVDVLLELALGERKLAESAAPNDISNAESAVNQALLGDPNHPRANVLRAQLTMEQLAKASADASAWTAPRQRLRAAMVQAPDDPYPALIFYRSFMAERRRPTDEAREAMARAFALQPESRSVRLSYGLSLAMEGKIEAARKVLKVLASDPHAAQAAAQALAALNGLAGAGGARGAAETAED